MVYCKLVTPGIDVNVPNISGVIHPHSVCSMTITSTSICYIVYWKFQYTFTTPYTNLRENTLHLYTTQNTLLSSSHTEPLTCTMPIVFNHSLIDFPHCPSASHHGMSPPPSTRPGQPLGPQRGLVRGARGRGAPRTEARRGVGSNTGLMIPPASYLTMLHSYLHLNVKTASSDSRLKFTPRERNFSAHRLLYLFVPPPPPPLHPQPTLQLLSPPQLLFL